MQLLLRGEPSYQLGHIMEIIQYAAERLKEGHRVNRITVRDFLRHFGAERRGAIKIEEIRGILDTLDLQTEPNFETAWIDEPIWLRLKGNVPPGDSAPKDELATEDLVLGSTPSAVEQAVEQSESAPYSVQAGAPGESGDQDTSDPTFRIGRLPAANKTLVTVNENDDVSRAVTLMVQYDFSQLPVMRGQREVKGIITWKSIGLRKALGSKCDRVRDCQEQATTIVDSDRTLFDTIPLIVDNGYVLVRQHDRRISGIVTASDLSLQFQTLSEPFLLLREIELHIRQIIKDKVTADDLSSLDKQPPPSRRLQDVADLTMGEYVRLFEDAKIWQKLNLSIDRVALTKLLDDVRKVRNEVMHFDPDPMTADDLAILKRAVRLMQEVYKDFVVARINLRDDQSA
jgi:CBS domain-containing protein